MQLKREGGWWFLQVFDIDPEKMKSIPQIRCWWYCEEGSDRWDKDSAWRGEKEERRRSGKDENKNANTNSNIHIKVHKYKVRKDYKKQEEEWDPEVLALRKEAAMKLDLRDRLERSPRRRVSLKDMIPTAGH